jgi:putative transposase
MYLTVILDWYSRYVVSWVLSEELTTDFVIEALEKALSKASPEIINSDQGSQYTSKAWVESILRRSPEIQISMDGRGRCLDNIFTERFWRSYKYEEVYLRDYETPRECRRGTAEYIDHYNHRRPHQALKNRTPYKVFTEGGLSL